MVQTPDLDIAAIRERLAIPDRWWEKFDHHQDPTEPRECTCGLSWPCCIGILMGEKAALLAEVERLREIAREAQRVREMLDSDGVGGVDWFNLSMVLDAYRLEATHD